MNRIKETKPRHTKPKYDLTGQTFGYLTALYWEKGKGWYCKCKCGNEKFVDSYYLRTGHTTSCGCKNRDTKNIIDMLGFENEYFKVIGQEEKIIGEYPKWICECKTCGRKFSLEGRHIRNYDLRSCGCVHSQGEQKIIKLLDSGGITYSKEYTFDDLIGCNGGRLRFDFAIFNEDNSLKRLIEFNGEQHYSKPKGKWADSFDLTVEHDRRKKEYCKNNNIDLKIIKYSDDFSLNDLIL